MISTCSQSRRLWPHCFRSAANISHAAGHQPKQPLHLDPSLRALLRDVDVSLHSHLQTRSHRELEVFSGPGDSPDLSSSTGPAHSEPFEGSITIGRKSPAAEFGSEKIGAVALPSQLTKSIKQLIQDSNKALLHEDAKRLFLNEHKGTDVEHGWDTHYDVRYRSRSQDSRHAERDGIAFASIALPAHYSAIVAVLHHLKKRLGPSWSIHNVIDWGAGTGSGLWATICTFQVSKHGLFSEELDDNQLSNSAITRYIGIDKRDGLVSMGKRLVEGIDIGNLQITWRKAFKGGDKEEIKGKPTLALSAFLLSSLPNPVARKILVKEIWESGAETIVLIDHNSAAGFEAIAGAREYLLKLGRKELEDPDSRGSNTSSLMGSYVIAPCPHDGVCPLYHNGVSQITCGFSQRIQRPDFVRRTKHSNIGHEDVKYSYVVIRRGTRTSMATTQRGRIGEVGLRALQKTAQAQMPIKELALHDGSEELISFESDVPAVPEALTSFTPPNQEDLEAALREESFSWPRLVFPPLKRSGHIILDGCTSEGKIMRMIIPRSQGKQPYYDARKSSWGDIFPHEPKNPGQERYPSTGGKHSDIHERSGKKSKLDGKKSTGLKDRRKKSRREELDALLLE